MEINHKYLLYLHNQALSPSVKGGLNTTMLQVFSMCKALTNNGMQVKLYIEGDDSFDENLTSFEKSAFKSKLPFEVFSWSKKSRNRLINRILIRGIIHNIIKKEKPDIIMTREPFFLKPILKTGIPFIYESHNSKQHLKWKLIDRYIHKEIIKTSRSKNFLMLFCISKALSHYWEKQNIQISKLFVWHDGFDSQLFINHEDKKEAREALNLPRDKRIAAYTGGLYPDREIENIIRLAQINPEVDFLVIGGPETNMKYFKSLALDQNVDNILFKGFINHSLVPLYLFASDVLLALWSEKVPTIQYCSPLKIFEYMASGRVILVHNFPTIREVLIDGVDSIFCQPQDFNDLNLRFKKALELSDHNELGISARRKAFGLYTWDHRARQMINFIEKQKFHEMN